MGKVVEVDPFPLDVLLGVALVLALTGCGSASCAALRVRDVIAVPHPGLVNELQEIVEEVLDQPKPQTFNTKDTDLWENLKQEFDQLSNSMRRPPTHSITMKIS
jgi:hypothetical protein